MKTANMIPGPIAMTPRKGIDPTPFGPDRAANIWGAAAALARYGPISDQLTAAMTPGEDAYVHAVWDAIPSGGSCYMSAFWAIKNGHIQPEA